jgi:phage-related protein
MNTKNFREILYYDTYYLEFFETLKPEVKKKFNWTLQLIASINQVPIKYFKHLSQSDGLYEIRVEFQGNIYRIFCCFDEGQVVILFNGFQKKSQKTPSGELAKAVRIMNEYFDEKIKQR